MKDYTGYTERQLLAVLQKKRHTSRSGAFGEVYNRYSKFVYAYIIKFFRNSDVDAGDIFHDTMIEFYNYSCDTRIESISKYLVGVARNKCLNYIRDNKAKVYIIDDGANLNANLQTNVNNELDVTFDFKEMYQKGLDSLNDEAREIFILKYYLGFSYIEIGELTGKDSNYLRLIMHRANTSLKTFLEPYYKEYRIEHNENT